MGLAHCLGGACPFVVVMRYVPLAWPIRIPVPIVSIVMLRGERHNQRARALARALARTAAVCRAVRISPFILLRAFLYLRVCFSPTLPIGDSCVLQTECDVVRGQLSESGR